MHIHKAYTCAQVDDVKRAMQAYPYAHILCMYKDIHVCINIDTHMCPSSVHIYCAYIYAYTCAQVDDVTCAMHAYPLHIYCAHVHT